MDRLTISVVLSLIAAGVARAEAEPPYVVIDVKDAVVPALPKPCGRAHPFSDHLLIFSSRYCAACDRYLRELAEVKQALERRKISVLVCVVDDVSCAQATRDSYDHGSWPVCVADDTVQKAWGGVSAQPTTFFVTGQHVRRVIKGRPPIQSLLSDLDKVRDSDSVPDSGAGK